MKRLIILVAIVSLPITNGQTVFRNITYQDPCSLIAEKLAAYRDIIITGVSCPQSFGGSITGYVQYLFGSPAVAFHWYEQVDSVWITIEFSKSGLEGYAFIENALAGFTEEWGEPRRRNPLTTYVEKPEVSDCLGDLCVVPDHPYSTVGEWLRIHESGRGHRVSLVTYYTHDPSDSTRGEYLGRINVTWSVLPRGNPLRDADQF